MESRQPHPFPGHAKEVKQGVESRPRQTIPASLSLSLPFPFFSCYSFRFTTLNHAKKKTKTKTKEKKPRFLEEKAQSFRNLFTFSRRLLRVI